MLRDPEGFGGGPAKRKVWGPFDALHRIAKRTGNLNLCIATALFEDECKVAQRYSQQIYESDDEELRRLEGEQYVQAHAVYASIKEQVENLLREHFDESIGFRW